MNHLINKCPRSRTIPLVYVISFVIYLIKYIHVKEELHMNKKEKQNYLCNLIRKLSEKQLDHLINLIRGMLGKTS